MKSWFVSILSLTVLVIITSCRSENEEEYFRNLVSIHTCDTISVTYTNQIKPIFDSKCIECRTSGSVVGCDLDSYDNSIKYITSVQPNTKLLDYVKNNDHQGVVIDTCSLKQLAKWMLNPAL